MYQVHIPSTLYNQSTNVHTLYIYLKCTKYTVLGCVYLKYNNFYFKKSRKGIRRKLFIQNNMAK